MFTPHKQSSKLNIEPLCGFFNQCGLHALMTAINLRTTICIYNRFHACTAHFTFWLRALSATHTKDGRSGLWTKGPVSSSFRGASRLRGRVGVRRPEENIKPLLCGSVSNLLIGRCRTPITARHLRGTAGRAEAAGGCYWLND